MNKFLHAGDMGDIIFSLPTIRALGGGELHLDPLGGLYDPLVKWADRKQTKLNEDMILSLKPVLELQPYINKVFCLGAKTKCDYNLNEFRKHIRYNNLSDSHLAAFNLPLEERDKQWLTIEPKKVAKTVICRSVRYHGNYSFWEANLGNILKDDTIFVGLPKEHEIFEYTFGKKVKFYPTPTIMELAQVISGSELFISNQGLPHALAEGMKKNLICEVYRVYPSAVFKRVGAEYV